ncbi:MAG: murein transglycosylase A [Alteraurantiacibacter sp. bin_em_oilr2.035]|nr:murein transglycosylase A [Aurantiacibacter atlanticus]MDF1833885.1 murein transglycosylase A [Alteraurantiacibacter sp. bin_em_oilr2.035]
MSILLRRPFPLSALLIALGLLAACARIVPAGPPQSSSQQPAAVAATAVLLGAVRLPSSTLARLDPANATSALEAFRTSCRVATARNDLSGLTVPSDWQQPCSAAAGWSRDEAAHFFNRHFVPVRIGDGTAFATGYFEPQIAGSRTRRSPADVPVYALPGDLGRCWRDDVPPGEREGRAPLGRQLPDGGCLPYYSRADIEAGALDGRVPVIAYAADAVEFFFLQIQGSGRIVTPAGEVIRIGYAGQNGRAYTGIGGVMRERGLLGDGPGQYPGSMQGIMQYLRENPRDGAALMRMNESWVFFRELTGEGPIGSIGVPVRGQSSIAVDPRYVPYGAPVLLDLDRREANGLWVAHDTGGAIRGPNRFDTFWGAGDRARMIAGGMSGRGQALVLLPLTAAARIGQ